MKQKHCASIKQVVQEHYTELENERSMYDSSYRRPSAEYEFVNGEAREEFEKISESFVVPKEDKSYFGSGNFTIEPLSYPHFSKEGVLFRTKNIQEEYRLEYYAGGSLDEVVFMGLIYALGFPYNKNFKKLGIENKASAISSLNEITSKFWEINSFNPTVWKEQHFKEYMQGMEDPFWDEYSRAEDASYIINMRFFKAGTNTSDFSEFLKYAHNRVKKIDTFLEQIYSINQNSKIAIIDK